MAREADDGPTKCESAVTDDDDDDDDDDDANAEDDDVPERTTVIIMTPLPNDLLWIPDLVRGVFFAPCERHSAGTKGEQVNLFSVGRRRAMCPACAAESSVSDAIQVRKRDVIEGLDDAHGGGVSYVRSASRRTSTRDGVRARRRSFIHIIAAVDEGGGLFFVGWWCHHPKRTYARSRVILREGETMDGRCRRRRKEGRKERERD